MDSRTFNPLDYGFRWTSDGWYEYASAAAETAAKQARDAFARELRQQGYLDVRKSTRRNNLFSKGGIGSGRPHIEVVSPVYVCTWAA